MPASTSTCRATQEGRSPFERAGSSKWFGALEAVAGIDLDVPRGMIFAILGPNGAGKTTLMRMLATLARPDAGSAEIMGHDLLAAPDEAGRHHQVLAPGQVLVERGELAGHGDRAAHRNGSP